MIRPRVVSNRDQNQDKKYKENKRIFQMTEGSRFQTQQSKLTSKNLSQAYDSNLGKSHQKRRKVPKYLRDVDTLLRYEMDLTNEHDQYVMQTILPQQKQKCVKQQDEIDQMRKEVSNYIQVARNKYNINLFDNPEEQTYNKNLQLKITSFENSIRESFVKDTQNYSKIIPKLDNSKLNQQSSIASLIHQKGLPKIDESAQEHQSNGLILDKQLRDSKSQPNQKMDYIPSSISNILQKYRETNQSIHQTKDTFLPMKSSTGFSQLFTNQRLQKDKLCRINSQQIKQISMIQTGESAFQNLGPLSGRSSTQNGTKNQTQTDFHHMRPTLRTASNQLQTRIDFFSQRQKQ